jgi:RNA polymerase sigma-70 factor (ECF subfamily)
MDRAAFLQTFEEYHQPLFRFAYRLTGSVADAEDVVQECFLELLRPGCAYDPERTAARTYLFGVVRNQSLKLLAKRDIGGEHDAEADEKSSPEHELLTAECGDVVARAVLRLPETQREVLLLAHYEQMALAEIAGIVGIEITAVKSRLQRARSALKGMLAAYAPELEGRK